MPAPASAASRAATPTRAILLMVAAMAVLTVNDTIAKWLTQTLPVGQVLTVRGCITVALAQAWAATPGRLAALRVRRWRLPLLPAALLAGSTFLFLPPLRLLPTPTA